MPTIPTSDAFGQGHWRQATPLEYLRGRVNGTTFTDADPILVWDSGQSAARPSDGILTGFLWRRLGAPATTWQRLRAKTLLPGGSTNVFCGGIARARPLNYTASATANRSDWFGGLAQGYVALMRQDGAITLYRAKAGALTSIATGSASITTGVLANLDLTVSDDTNGDPALTVKVNGVTIINAYVDTHADKVLDAGHQGFVLQYESASGRGWWADYWRLRDSAQTVTYIDDDFDRPSQALITYGGSVQPALLWEFGDLEGSAPPTFDSDRLLVSAAATTPQHIDLYQRTPDGPDQFTEAKIRFDGMAANPSHLAGVIVRGSKSAKGTGTGSFTGYAAVFVPQNPSGYGGLRLLRYDAGSLTTLALVRRPVPADRDLRLGLQIESSGAAADLTVTVDDVPVITYTDAAAIAGPGLQGLAYLWACHGASCANSGSIYFDDFVALSAPAAPAPPSIGGEPEIEGTLAYRPEAPEQALPIYQVTRHLYERGYRQTWATFRRPRMAWPVQWICDDADKAAIVGYLQARQRDGKAFYLDGAWGTGKAWMLAGPVRYSLIDPGIWRVGPVDLIERLDVTAVP